MLAEAASSLRLRRGRRGSLRSEVARLLRRYGICGGEDMTMDHAVQTRGRVRVERCRKRLRALVAGAVVFDTTDARYVWEAPYYPTYYVPAGDVKVALRPNG